MVDFEEFGFKQEKFEELSGQILKTDYPEPLQRLRIVHESPTEDVEKSYFWFLDFLRTELGLGNIRKINDVFSASEQSSAFGASQQRLGAQQAQASQYLGTIAQMVTNLFPLIRELRQIDERLEYYDRSTGKKEGNQSAAEISLRGMWVDLVEGGRENPTSVLGLADKVGFKSLPDLFFRTKLENVDSLKFNEKVKEILKRKLFQFNKWKEQTYKELTGRRGMTLKYLRQYYSSIRMYMSWVKPYLHNIKKLNMNMKKLDSPDLISAFESTIIEIEILATEPDNASTKEEEKKNKVYPCLLLNFDYMTKPLPFFNQEQQRGNRFVGRMEVNIRAYTWTKQEIQSYMNLKAKEDIELISQFGGDLGVNATGDPISSLSDSMNMLGEDMKKYLEEAGEEFDTPKNQGETKKTPSKSPMPSVIDPFLNIFRGFGEVAVAFAGNRPGKEKPAPSLEGKKAGAKKKILKQSAILYKIYKKAHGMNAW